MKTLILSIICLILLPAAALAGGLQVNPEKLNFELDAATAQTRKLVIINPAADVQLFEVYADEEAPGLTINPASFTLEAGARKDVAVNADAGKLKPGVSLFTLSVLARPLSDSRVAVNAGAKIPVMIKIAPANPRHGAPSAGAIIGLAAAALLYGIWKNFVRKS